MLIHSVLIISPGRYRRQARHDTKSLNSSQKLRDWGTHLANYFEQDHMHDMGYDANSYGGDDVKPPEKGDTAP